MTNDQWDALVRVVRGRTCEPTPVGFVIDSPWLPGWAGISTIDYYCSGEKWLHANLRAIKTFPDILFLPGFWAEFGMCTEPSAFGTKCRWARDELPYAEKIIRDIGDIAKLEKPDPRTDGLPPFVLNRLQNHREAIEKAGHYIRFAVSRGPLNIATFLMGTTEFLMAIRTDPDKVKHLLNLVTDFVTDWLKLQAEMFTTIDGVFILDDIVGFLGPEDFETCAQPYLKRVFDAVDVTVKFFHNDAPGLVCAPYLAGLGVNLFNFGFEHSLTQMRELTDNRVALLGNIPPRDVLAAGTPEDVAKAVETALESLANRSRIVLSCGGGMPPGVPTENITAFAKAAAAK